MANKRWTEDPIKIIDNIENAAIIPERDFEELNNIYKFKYIPQYRVYFDTKWNKTVAKKTKFFNDTNIIINVDWLKTELFRSNSSTVLLVCKRNIELRELFNEYNKQKHDDWMKFKKSLETRKYSHAMEKIDTE